MKNWLHILFCIMTFGLLSCNSEPSSPMLTDNTKERDTAMEKQGEPNEQNDSRFLGSWQEHHLGGLDFMKRTISLIDKYQDGERDSLIKNFSYAYSPVMTYSCYRFNNDSGGSSVHWGKVDPSLNDEIYNKWKYMNDTLIGAIFWNASNEELTYRFSLNDTAKKYIYDYTFISDEVVVCKIGDIYSLLTDSLSTSSILDTLRLKTVLRYIERSGI